MHGTFDDLSPTFSQIVRSDLGQGCCLEVIVSTSARLGLLVVCSFDFDGSSDLQHRLNYHSIWEWAQTDSAACVILTSEDDRFTSTSVSAICPLLFDSQGSGGLLLSGPRWRTIDGVRGPCNKEPATFVTDFKTACS